MHKSTSASQSLPTETTAEASGSFKEVPSIVAQANWTPVRTGGHSSPSLTDQSRTQGRPPSAISSSGQRSHGRQYLSSRTSLPLSPETVRRNKRQRMIGVFTIVALLLSAGVTIVPVMYFFKQQRKKVVYCHTEECAQHIAELSATMNRSVDPCHSFRDFVCGRYQGALPWDSFEYRMAFRWAEISIAELEKDILRMGRPARFFYSCTTASRMRSRNLEQFLQLKRSVGLLWPEGSNPTVHPVEVMINLAINWNMNFLFDLRVLPNASDVPFALLMTTGRLGVSWRYRYRTVLMNPEQYNNYVNLTFEALGLETEHWDYAQLQKLERSIVEAKIQIIQGKHHQEWFPLGSLDAFLPSAKGGFWIEIFNQHFSGEVNWTPDHFLVVQDVSILKSVGRLLTEHGTEQLHIGLSWIFIQSHLWAVLGMPKLIFPENTDMMQKYGCIEYIDTYLGLLSMREHIVQRYGTPDMGDFIESVKRTVIAKLANQALSNNDDGAGAAKRKIATMKVNILPSAEFFSNQEREQLYRFFPRMTNTAFVANLISLSRLHRRLLFDKKYSDVYGKRMLSDCGQSIYIYPTNYLEVPLLTLEPPMYYTQTAFSINYAGLGAIVARDMIRAFDSRGVAIDEAGRSDPWWGPSMSTSYKRWLECNDSEFPGDVNRSEAGDTYEQLIMSAPALEVAFEAYTNAASKDTVKLGSLHLGDSVEFTHDQIFFITYCHMLCTPRNETVDGDDECTYAVKNFEPFAEAFDCPPDSPMNPSRKCSFFRPTGQ